MQKIRDHIDGFIDEMIALRRDFHMHPELSRQEFRTSAIVADLLEKWGYEVTRNVGGTGVVGRLKAGHAKTSIGIRADMDALPIDEETNLSYASKNPGVMHACGHDGHTTMLLAAARYMAETKNFNGIFQVIFQPAEEGFGGARLMVEDGLFDRFPVDHVFGLHNWPGIPVGQIAISDGPMMAAVDTVNVTIQGKGAHGASPEASIDPIVAASSIVMALQSVVSRNVSPMQTAVVTVGSFQSGSASNIIPDKAELKLSIRSFSKDVGQMMEERIKTIVHQQALSFGASGTVEYLRDTPAVINHVDEKQIATEVAQQILGQDKVDAHYPPVMISEDFSVMLENCPGSFLFLGNGDSAGLHSPFYNFNDSALIVGATYWAALAKKYLS